MAVWVREQRALDERRPPLAAGPDARVRSAVAGRRRAGPPRPVDAAELALVVGTALAMLNASSLIESPVPQTARAELLRAHDAAGARPLPRAAPAPDRLLALADRDDRDVVRLPVRAGVADPAEVALAGGEAGPGRGERQRDGDRRDRGTRRDGEVAGSARAEGPGGVRERPAVAGVVAVDEREVRACRRVAQGRPARRRPQTRSGRLPPARHRCPGGTRTGPGRRGRWWRPRRSGPGSSRPGTSSAYDFVAALVTPST